VANCGSTPQKPCIRHEPQCAMMVRSGARRHVVTKLVLPNCIFLRPEVAFRNGAVAVPNNAVAVQ
jgi:hypothetical protein